jgi:hypothetical protein
MTKIKVLEHLVDDGRGGDLVDDGGGFDGGGHLAWMVVVKGRERCEREVRRSRRVSVCCLAFPGESVRCWLGVKMLSVFRAKQYAKKTSVLTVHAANICWFRVQGSVNKPSTRATFSAPVFTINRHFVDIIALAPHQAHEGEMTRPLSHRSC